MVESTYTTIIVLSFSLSIVRHYNSEFSLALLVIILPLIVKVGDYNHFILYYNMVLKSSSIVSLITLVDTS